MRVKSQSRSSARAAAQLGASVVALALAAPAFAQEDASRGGIDTITVTAQFREQNLQDTPLSITAMDAELLESRSADSIFDVALQAPNVILQENTSTFGTGIATQIRGVGQFDFNPALEPGVGIYVDDVYFATLVGANLDLLDLERVEILRGPQGTLSGRNSAGGAVRLISKAPTGDGSGFFSAGYGAFNAVDVRAGADLGISDTLAVRLSGVHKRKDGHIKNIDYGCAVPGNPEGIEPTIQTDNCVIDRFGEENYTGLRAQALWEPMDRLAITITGDYTIQDQAPGGDVRVAPDGTPNALFNPNFVCGPYCNYADFIVTNNTGMPQFTNFGPGAPEAIETTYPPRNRTFDGWGVSGKLEFELSENLQFVSISAYREYNTVFGTDDDFSPEPILAAGGYNELDHEFFSQEVRLNGNFGDFAEFTIGGYYSDQLTTYFTVQDIRYLPIPGFAFQFVGNDPVNADSKAVFGTLILHPTEDLTITGGVRYTDEHKDYTFSRTGLANPSDSPGLVGPLDGTTAIYDGDKVDYRVSVDYRFSDALLAYATVSTGFKGGGVTPRPFNVNHALNGSFDPETVTNYEIGFKSDLFDNRLRVNVAGFLMKYKNIQLPLTDCSFIDPGGPAAPCAAIGNAGDGTYKGVEAEVLFAPTDSFTADASASYLHTEYDSVLPQAGGGVILFPGDAASSAPDWKFSAGAQNVFELGGNKGTITPRFDIAYVGERLLGQTQAFIPDYMLGNARVTWRNPGEDISVALEVTNLFDKYYTFYRFDALYTSNGNVQDAVGRPREWMLTVRKDF
jgi:iron complex outermembrane receptor protein